MVEGWQEDGHGFRTTDPGTDVQALTHHEAVPHPSAGELARLAAALEAEIDAIARSATDAVVAHVDAYRSSDDAELIRQLGQHVRDVFAALVRCLREDRVPQPQDLTLTSEVALNRVAHGIGLSDFLRATRIVQIGYWNRLVPILVEQNASVPAIARTVYLMLQLVELTSSSGADALLEAQQFRATDHERLRSEIVEDLINGRPPVIGPRRGILEAVGLRDNSAFVVCAISPSDGTDDTAVLWRIRNAVRAALGRTVSGLVIGRPNEVLAMLPSGDNGASAAERILVADGQLRSEGTKMRVGISTSHSGWTQVPDAYREACTALEAMGDDLGVRRVSTLSAVEYLTLLQDDTAARLIEPRIRTFVEAELDCDGVLLDTIEAYALAGMSARAAAERLGVHANTAYYRLERIAQRTDLDLRHFASVMNLLVAVRILRAGRRRTPG